MINFHDGGSGGQDVSDFSRGSFGSFVSNKSKTSLEMWISLRQLGDFPETSPTCLAEVSGEVRVMEFDSNSTIATVAACSTKLLTATTFTKWRQFPSHETQNGSSRLYKEEIKLHWVCTKWRQSAMRTWWRVVYQLSMIDMLRKCRFLHWNFATQSKITWFNTCPKRTYNCASDSTLVINLYC